MLFSRNCYAKLFFLRKCSLCGGIALLKMLFLTKIILLKNVLYLIYFVGNCLAKHFDKKLKKIFLAEIIILKIAKK